MDFLEPNPAASDFHHPLSPATKFGSSVCEREEEKTALEVEKSELSFNGKNNILAVGSGSLTPALLIIFKRQKSSPNFTKINKINYDAVE